jgi:UDP-N-acetylmuramate: L-alanyl-gamma-D-glutamyl-meso-diaminopimelate ligase
VEFDHADIYADMDAYRAAYHDFIALIPEDGTLFAFDGDPEVRALAERAACRVLPYGLGPGEGLRALDIEEGPSGTSFLLVSGGTERGRVLTPLAGRHNVANTLAALGMVEAVGVAPDEAAGLLAGYGGVARRMQVRGVAAGVTVIDDFAHHPTAVRETVRAVRRLYPAAELVAVFEPRTNTSRRRFFQDRYPRAFGDADRVVLVPPYDPARIPEEERFDSGRLVEDLRARGQDARLAADADEVVRMLKGGLDPGAVVLVMSNGAFDGIHNKLLEALGERERRAP